MFYCFKLQFSRNCSADFHFPEELPGVSRYNFTFKIAGNINRNICFADPGRTKQNYKKILHWNLSPGRLFFVLVQVFNIFEIRKSFFVISVKEKIINFRFVIIIIINRNYNIVIKFPCRTTKYYLFGRDSF